MLKWLAALLGFMVFNVPGLILGFLFGSFFDSVKGGEAKVVFNQGRTVSPADFELHLISLSSLIIKADGKVNETELQYVRQYFVSTYGKERANAIFRTFNEVIKKREISVAHISSFLSKRTRYEVRLQIVHFLFGIAHADGFVSEAEQDVIQQVAYYFRVQPHDFESIKAMFVEAAGNAYKILEIDKHASDAEVKKAYRKMVKKYHPDKVVTENEAIKKGAEEKFKEVQKAYEQIQKERGLN
ncbi:MAG: TerB family tellurite resistance protein [Flavobacteriaceae bacterium]|nr:TerB family tellurite resistance protein [Flavobacteriaceae bacterium]